MNISETQVGGPPTAATDAAVRTFLIADVRGYTRFTQEHGDEAAVALAGRFAQVCEEVVGAHHGEVAELRGDEALAVFASAREALRAAADLRKRFIEESEKDPSLPLHAGIGLDAGEAIAFREGYRGAALNLAARLCSLAASGEVLASEGVIHLARKVEGLEYAERGAVQLKGFSDPIRVVQVLEPADLQPTAAASGSINAEAVALPIGGFLGALPESMLVARDEEFGRILVGIDAVVGGSGRLILLSGEPGIGKTRLAQEVTLNVRNRGFIVAAGRCYEPRQDVPYYPFLEALAGVVAAAPPQLRADIPQRWPYLARLLPEQAEPSATSPIESRDEQERLFRAVTAFLQTVAAEVPVALLLDDLHWSDGSSLELLQHLARHTRAYRVLLLGSYRDVEVQRQHPLGRAVRDLQREHLVERIPVRRLGYEGTRELIKATMGEAQVSDEFTGLVHGGTEGNPFFTEEVLRALIERGDVFREDGHWEKRDVEEIIVPESVRDAIGERLSHLSEEAQLIMREASVLGQTFQFEDLERLSGRDEREIEEALEEGRAAGIVLPGEHDEYSFNHALTQQAIYAELSPRRSRRLHLAAGEALEALGERDRKKRAAELARHFLQADETERAMRYGLLAADEAMSVFAYREAEEHYRQAAELARELQDAAHEAESLEKLGHLLRIRGRGAEACEILERATERYRGLPDVEGEARAVAEIGLSHAQQGNTKAGFERIRPVLESLERRGPSFALGQLYLAARYLAFFSGEYHEVLAYMERLAETARAINDPEMEAWAAVFRGQGLDLTGRHAEALEAAEEGLRLAEQIQKPDVLQHAHIGMGEGWQEEGDLERTRAHRLRSIELLERGGELDEYAFAMSNLGQVLYYLGEWPEAVQWCRRAIELTSASRSLGGYAYPILHLGMIELGQGEEELGREHLTEAIEIATEAGDKQLLRYAQNALAEQDVQSSDHEAAVARLEPLLDPPGQKGNQATVVFATLARAYFEMGREDRAEELVSEGVERASRLIRVELPGLLRTRAIICERKDRWEEAEKAFTEAISLAAGMPYPYEQAKALYELGTMLARRGDKARARTKLDEASAIFQRLGAEPYRQRTEGALADLN